MKMFSTLVKYKDYVLYSSKISITSRYTSMYLGIIWWFIDPLIMMAIYAFVYIYIFNAHTANYIVFLLIGIIVWRLISNSISQNTSAISSKMGILEQTAAPKQIYPLVTLIVETVMFAFAFLLVVAAAILDNVPITWHYLELIPLVAVTFILLYGVGLTMAHFGAFIADLRPIMNYSLRLLFYLSPIFYSLSMLSPRLQHIYSFNPITTMVESYRAIIIGGQSPDYLGIGILLLIGLALLAFGWWLIEKYDKEYGKLK